MYSEGRVTQLSLSNSNWAIRVETIQYAIRAKVVMKTRYDLFVYGLATVDENIFNNK